MRRPQPGSYRVGTSRFNQATKQFVPGPEAAKATAWTPPPSRSSAATSIALLSRPPDHAASAPWRRAIPGRAGSELGCDTPNG